MDMPGFSVFGAGVLHSIKPVKRLVGVSYGMVDFDSSETLRKQSPNFRNSLKKYTAFWIFIWLMLIVSTAYLVSHESFRLIELIVICPLWFLFGAHSVSVALNVKALRLNQVFGYLLQEQKVEAKRREADVRFKRICALTSEIHSAGIGRVEVSSSWLCKKDDQLVLLELATLSTRNTTVTTHRLVTLEQYLQRMDANARHSPRVSFLELAMKIAHPCWSLLPQYVLTHEAFGLRLMQIWPLLIEYIEDCSEQHKRQWVLNTFAMTGDINTPYQVLVLNYLKYNPMGHHIPSVIALEMVQYALEANDADWLKAVYQWLDAKLLPTSIGLVSNFDAMLGRCNGHIPIAVRESDIKWAIEDFYERIIKMIIEYHDIDGVVARCESDESKQGFMALFGLDLALKTFPQDRALFIKHSLNI